MSNSKVNTLVLNKIESMDLDENTKECLIELIDTEIRLGDADKKTKTKQCRKTIEERCSE